jgi:hypothetical protein
MENLSLNSYKERGKEEKKDNKEISKNFKIEEEKQEVEEKEISEEELIEFLKSREPGNSEAVECLRKWIDQKQKKVGPTSKDQLNFNLHWAQMYERAGWSEGEGRMNS